MSPFLAAGYYQTFDQGANREGAEVSLDLLIVLHIITS